jgi:hypothetical protein
MADNVTILDADEAEVVIGSDDCSGVQVQLVKLAQSADGSATPIAADGDGLEVQVTKGTITAVTDITNAVKVTDNDGALTVDNGGTFAVQASPVERAVTMLHARVALSATQPGATVLDPTAGKKCVLHKIVVSCATAGVVDFFYDTDSGDDVIGPLVSLAANGGWTETWDLCAPRRSASADDVLKYTTTTFVGSVYIEYWEE